MSADVLRAEWTKFRTVRGWVAAAVAVAALTVVIALLNHSSCGTVSPEAGGSTAKGCSAPVGPGGEAVTDNFYLVHQPLAGDGSITARLTSLTGSSPDSGGAAALPPWAKAGIIVTAGTKPGSAYAALLVTAGHGVRMQYDYTGDIAGPAGGVSATAPRWLRLTRSGDTLTGYQSTDGTQWTVVGAARLPGLPATAQVGLFAASPGWSSTTVQSLGGSGGIGGAILATARFEQIGLRGAAPVGMWTGDNIGGGDSLPPGIGFQPVGGGLTVTGTGDIAPDVPNLTGGDGVGMPIERTLLGVFAGLLVVVVIATSFMTAEYRRGLIRVTFAACPQRGQVLAAKAAVTGSVAFVAGLVGAGTAVALGVRLMRSNGDFVLPVSTFTELRVVVGTAGLLAVAAVLALALGALLRSGAVAVTAAIGGIVLPYLLATTLLPAGPADWVLRLTPAAAFAVQQSIPAYPQVDVSYTPVNGYFPLPPWAGFAVLCGYAAAALGLAVVLVRRRDA